MKQLLIILLTCFTLSASAQVQYVKDTTEGLLVYVTNTDGTFTAKGWWGWDGAAWQKLNN